MSGGSVSAYFNNAWIDLWDAGIREAFFGTKYQYPGYELWVPSHFSYCNIFYHSGWLSSSFRLFGKKVWLQLTIGKKKKNYWIKENILWKSRFISSKDLSLAPFLVIWENSFLSCYLTYLIIHKYVYFIDMKRLSRDLFLQLFVKLAILLAIIL